MSYLYNAYLDEHVSNVTKGFNWLHEHIPDIIYDEYTGSVLCNCHDNSKYSSIEYDAYDEYFYGNNRSSKVVNDFNRAWLHHIHDNPHHWQHWVLVNDDPKKGSIALEMDRKYVIEMICDWWSFSWKTGNLYEIFDWYEKHKDYMILHKNTRKLVEDILNKIREKLDSENNN